MDKENLQGEYFSFNSSVLVPIAQATVTGALVALVGEGVGLMLDYHSPPALALTVGAGVALLVWRDHLAIWRGYLYSLAEGDGFEVIEPEPARVRVEIPSNEGRTLQLADLPANLDQLIALGAGLVEGASMTEARWIGRGRPFTRGEFIALRDELIRRGFARWNSPGTPARGVLPTKKGLAIMRHFASMTVSPPTLLSRR